MVFWIGIVLAVLLAVFCARRGFYETWAFAFNSVTAIYIAVFAEPYVSQTVPSASDTPFGDMLVVAGIAAAVFFVLHGISYVFVTGQFAVSFPKVLDLGGAGLLGFLSGVVIWNFVVFMVCNSSIFPKELAAQINYDNRIRQFNIEVFSAPCNALNMLVSHDSSFTTQQAVDGLLKATGKTDETASSKVTPEKPAEPSKLLKKEPKKEPMGPPPEIESPGA